MPGVSAELRPTKSFGTERHGVRDAFRASASGPTRPESTVPRWGELMSQFAVVSPVGVEVIRVNNSKQDQASKLVNKAGRKGPVF